MRSFVAFMSLVCLVLGLLASPLQAQTVADTNNLIKVLEDPIETKNFSEPLTLKDALGLLYEKFAAQGKELPILVNEAAFREEDVKNEFFPYDSQISLLPIPRTMKVGTALRMMLAKIPQKATFLIRAGYIEIVPEKCAKTEHLLRQNVLATFTQRPLVEAVQELSAQTGLSIIIDGREETNAKKLVTATFRNDVTLRDALVMLTRMADMEVEFMPSGVFITAQGKGAKRP